MQAPCPPTLLSAYSSGDSPLTISMRVEVMRGRFCSGGERGGRVRKRGLIEKVEACSWLSSSKQ